MRAIDCLEEAAGAGDRFQLVVNGFVDAFRRSTPAQRLEMRSRFKIRGLEVAIAPADATSAGHSVASGARWKG